MGDAFGLAFLLVPMWFFLACSLSVSASQGGLDWLGLTRGMQHTLIVVTCLTLLVATWFSGALSGEPANQTPWAVRPLMYWAVYLFPVVIFCFSLLNANSGLGASVPPLLLRIPVGLVGGVSLLVSCGLLLELAISNQQRQAQQVDAIISREDQLNKSRI